MISLTKYYDIDWRRARGSLRADMDHIEAAINQRWNSTFGDSNLLKPGVVTGISTVDSRYISNQGAGHTLLWDQINLVNGVKNTLAVGNGGTGSAAFTAGSIVFSNGTILTQDNADLFWDNTNKRQGIGTTSPATELHISRDATGSSTPGVKLTVQNLSTAAAANLDAVVVIKNSTNSLLLDMHCTGQTGTRMGINFANLAEIITSGAAALSILTNDAVPIYFGSGAPSAPHMTLNTTGNFGIGTTSTPYRLNVKANSTGGVYVTSVANYNEGFNLESDASGNGVGVNLNNIEASGHSYIFFSSGSLNSVGNGAFAIFDGTDGAYRFVLKPTTGNIGFGVIAPTASLHLRAGTASANTAPIKLTSGTVLTTPEAGTIEYDGTNFYLTP